MNGRSKAARKKEKFLISLCAGYYGVNNIYIYIYIYAHPRVKSSGWKIKYLSPDRSQSQKLPTGDEGVAPWGVCVII